MSAQLAIPRLEALCKVIRAMRDTKHSYPTQFSEGLVAGLDLALEHIERELRWAKELDAAIEASVSPKDILLIPAAPGMLEALRVAEESVGDLKSLEIVRAAIATATGSPA